MHWTHWAESAEQNKDAIGEAIAPYLQSVHSVLEIGSGTGQHAVHFAKQHAHLRWQPSEHPTNLGMLQQNLQRHGGPNISQAIELDASAAQWPTLQSELTYSANTLHIMPEASVEQLFRHLGQLLQAEQFALFYGPFKFSDRPFAPSNSDFDRWLKQNDARSGVRSVDDLRSFGASTGLSLTEVIEMPANNHILAWRRTPLGE